MPRLIINADDLGLTAGVNRAIAEGHRAGSVTSATLMANAEAFEDAVRVAGLLPTLAVGCHVNLIDGKPLTGSAPASLLSNGKEFDRGYVDFALRAIAGRFSPSEVEAEAFAQFARIKAAGIVPTHFDSHKHTHMFPAVLRPLLRAAQAHGVPAVRNPFEAAYSIAWRSVFTGKAVIRRVQVRLLRGFAARFHAEVEAHGMRTTGGTLGIAATGTFHGQTFRSILSSMPEGTFELVCHPGYNDADLQKKKTRLKESRVTELAALTDAENVRFIRECGIQLISYRDI